MVVVAIMIMLMGGGFAAYLHFNSRQLLLNSGSQLQLLMVTAQKEARVGSKPTGCARLLSYAVVVNSGQLSSASLVAECSNNSYTTQTITFDTGVTSTASFAAHFLVLTGGVVGAGNFTLQKGSQTVVFTVNQGGSVSSVGMGP